MYGNYLKFLEQLVGGGGGGGEGGRGRVGCSSVVSR